MRGETVILYEETPNGTLPTGEITYEVTPVEVHDVLIGEPSSEELLSSVDLYGKSLRVILGIPKGDTHDWVNKRVDWTDAYGNTHSFITFGYPITGVEANIPTRWHMKVRCAQYE